MLEVVYSEDSNTYYLMFKGLDAYMLMEKVGLLQWYKDIVSKHGAEFSVIGEDFFVEEEAYDALEDIERHFEKENVFFSAIKKTSKTFPDIDGLRKYLVVFDRDELNEVLQKGE